jgi:hypothetical protein
MVERAYLSLRTEQRHAGQTRNAVVHIVLRIEEDGMIVSACGQLTLSPENCIISDRPHAHVCATCIRRTSDVQTLS